MNSRFKWAALLTVVLVAILVGSVAYNAGVSQGLAIGAANVPAAGAAPGQGVPPYYWYRPWGHWGFGFGPFGFVLLWFLLFRLVFWGGGWRRRSWYHYPYDVPPSFEEWHRRAHERMNQPAQPQV
jgi:hypothetical protein